MRGNPHLCEPLAERECETMPGIRPCDCDEEWESCPRSGRSFRANAKPYIKLMFVKHRARVHMYRGIYIYIYITALARTTESINPLRRVCLREPSATEFAAQV